MKNEEYPSVVERDFDGKVNRMHQIFRASPSDGRYRTVMFAIDHPYFYGPTTGLEDPRKLMHVFPYADAFSPDLGTLQRLDDTGIQTPFILRISGGNSILDKEGLSNEDIIVSVEEAAKLNAVGVSVSLYVDSDHRNQTFRNLSNARKRAHELGLIVLGITAVGANLEERTKEQGEGFARYLAHCGGLIQSAGADIVKTYHCPNFEYVREKIQKRIVIAGGKKTSEREALEYTFNSIRDGADGVDMGRNIFQAENPVAMIQAVRKIVHEGMNAQKAYQFYQKLSRPQSREDSDMGAGGPGD
ncbi:MAG: 3-hydroxy-5-phosphonooxypentane-2,4-dione thiolase LsrF [Nanoarchaeota archaeon]